jgi:hypothetical protein
MKTILGGALGALLLTGAAMAATPGQDAGQSPSVTYQESVSANAAQAPVVRDSTWALVNRTGSGH